MIDFTFPRERAVEALEKSRTGHPSGKVIVKSQSQASWPSNQWACQMTANVLCFIKTPAGVRASCHYPEPAKRQMLSLNRVVVKIDADQNVEGWTINGLDVTPPSESTVLLHLKTNKAAGRIEFTAGGENIGFYTVHFKSNANFIYVKDDLTESCLRSGGLR